LKISLVEGPRRRRLIVDGKLIAPWVVEFAAACEKAMAVLHRRELIIDLRNLTAISPEGESVPLQLMRKKVEFQCGIFMKELLRQLARKSPTRERVAGGNAPPKTRMGQNGLRVETATVNVDSFDSFDKFAILAGSYRLAPKRQFESRGFCTSLSGSNLYVCAAVARASSAAARAFSSAARVTRCSWILIMLSASLEVAMPCGKRQPHSARLPPDVRLSQHCELSACRGVSSRQVDGSRSASYNFLQCSDARGCRAQCSRSGASRRNMVRLSLSWRIVVGQ